ncbi:hypothetical protein EIQ06_10845 [Xanthomonas campestris pv. campestris]|uniref:Lipoprotein n=2 Tax=Xanthomonas campestris pv. campestris TaxID=340 RepID=A0A0H2XDF8_XANC8|nr:hypothetical protein [Xanthomonas campestris]AAY50871.1 conserved hypothetical protein [Xanthomonas campestris pv. campestris str. 8004]AKS17697.1 hypothetical protein AEA00_18390 [Xanthomonas campestris pv. campestris]AKS21709.1 hypothetical protein AEA01_18435 [Xanthomonas campestris pv. campestris]ALE70269.1 hypothetical protein AAW18_18555 [Xanthomonas campestris pv. campestris]MBD8248308.1 hypothetical protein [Xanthomonas campestris]
MKIHWAVLACATLALAACQRPQPAPTEQKPEPQATALRDHIQQPLDKARGVRAATDQAAAQQRATIDAATQ